jgi:hypothetical protein
MASSHKQKGRPGHGGDLSKGNLVRTDCLYSGSPRIASEIKLPLIEARDLEARVLKREAIQLRDALLATNNPELEKQIEARLRAIKLRCFEVIAELRAIQARGYWYE